MICQSVEEQFHYLKRLAIQQKDHEEVQKHLHLCSQLIEFTITFYQLMQSILIES